MKLDWQDIQDRGSRGIGVSKEEAEAITALTDESDLTLQYETADAIRQSQNGNAENTCGLTNARRGSCPVATPC